MTQKEIWTGYWNTFCNMFAPVALFQAIASIFRRKRLTPAEYRALFPQAPPHKLHRDDRLESIKSQEQIRKILNEMLNEAKKSS